MEIAEGDRNANARTPREAPKVPSVGGATRSTKSIECDRKIFGVCVMECMYKSKSRVSKVVRVGRRFARVIRLGRSY